MARKVITKFLKHIRHDSHRLQLLFVNVFIIFCSKASTIESSQISAKATHEYDWTFSTIYKGTIHLDQAKIQSKNVVRSFHLLFIILIMFLKIVCIDWSTY